MKIRHSWVAYIIPAILAFLCIDAGIVGLMEEAGSDAGKFGIILGLIIIGLSVIDYFTTYLEVKDKVVSGSVGLIKKQKLSTPVGNINGCDVTKILIFNKVKVTSGLTVIELKNMKNADDFNKAIAFEQSK